MLQWTFAGQWAIVPWTPFEPPQIKFQPETKISTREIIAQVK